METVRALAVAGARVVFTSRSLPAGEEVAASLRKDPRVKVLITSCPFLVRSAAWRWDGQETEAWLNNSGPVKHSGWISSFIRIVFRL